MELAEALGLASVLVRTGHGRSELKRLPRLAGGRAVRNGLSGAAVWIERNL
jgi:hypothetical protein